jgi:hypothetical protein
VLFAICNAQLRCTLRRVDAAFAAAPLVVGAAGLGAAALPALAFWAGTRSAPALRAADPFVLALGAGLAAALAGAVLTLLAPGRHALGAQLEAAPIPRTTAFVGLTLLPPGVALALLGLPVALFAAPGAGHATPLVLARLLGAAAAGGAGAEAALTFGRRSLRGVPVAAGLALLVLAWESAFVVPFALALWLVAAAVRPDERPVRASVRVLGRGLVGTTALRYARRRELRRQAAAACVLAVAGAASLRAIGTPNQVAVLLGGSTVLLGAAVVPLAAPGVDLRTRWLWRSAPRRAVELTALHGGVALALGFVVAAIGVAGSLAVAPVAPAVALPLAVGAVVVLGAAFLAGSLVPWQSDRLADQLAGYAAFGVVLSALWFALARGASLVGAEHGVQAGALALAALAGCFGAAVLVTGSRA